MNPELVPPPVDRRVRVALPPDQAFELFTGHMRAWWPFAGHSCGGDESLDVLFEPRVGGSVTEVLRDGRRFAWGTLSEWTPPAAFAMSWHPGLPQDAATRLRVSFTPCEGGTEVRVLHDGWAARGEQAQAKRDQYDGGWPATLQAFGLAAAQWPAVPGLVRDPARFVWVELATPDRAAAARFYGAVAGWTFEDTDMPGGYTLVKAGPREIGGLRPLDAGGGESPAWTGYLSVADCDAALAEALAAGATAFGPAQDIPGIGRFAAIADPQGAAVVLYRDFGAAAPGASPSAMPGGVGWHELVTADAARALGWYARLFGWTPAEPMDMGAMGTYRMFGAGTEPMGGMMDRPPGVERSAWLFYFDVEAIDAAAARVRAGGGTVTMEPMEVPGGSWVLQGTDPQGVPFALVAPRR